jgi:hypothetical protein
MQVDLDGSFRYAKSVFVEMADPGHAVEEVLPNPNKDRFTLSVKLPEGLAYQVRITDTNGQVRWAQGGTSEGEFNLAPALADLPTGIYFIRASTAMGQVVRRFEVE